MSTSSDHWPELLHETGLRATSARVQILDALEALGHATPEQVHARTKDVNLSTVYRTLEALAEHHVVSHIHLGEPSVSYMLAAHATHGHLVCRKCGGVFELDGPTTEAFVGEVEARQGFTIDAGHLSVFGQCHSCSDRAHPHH